MELTNEYMDDLVEEWHTMETEDSLTDYLCYYTGLSYDDIIHWIETAELPDE